MLVPSVDHPLIRLTFVYSGTVDASGSCSVQPQSIALQHGQNLFWGAFLGLKIHWRWSVLSAEVVLDGNFERNVKVNKGFNSKTRGTLIVKGLKATSRSSTPPSKFHSVSVIQPKVSSHATRPGEIIFVSRTRRCNPSLWLIWLHRHQPSSVFVQC